MDVSFDIVMRENDFILYSDGKPMLTKNRNEIAHVNARILRLSIIQNMETFGDENTALYMLSSLIDINAGLGEAIDFDLDEALSKDALLSNGADNSGNLETDFLINHPAIADFIFLNASSLSSSLNNFLVDRDESCSVSEYFIQSINQLTDVQKIGLSYLYKNSGSSLIIHFLLLAGYISMTEYTAGLLIEDLKKNKRSIKKLEENIKTYIQYSNNKTQVVLDFLTLSNTRNKFSVVEEIIKRGEDDTSEFKSTLRWDLRQEKKNPAIEHASLKTICAFLNSNGGDLLIGVRDDASIEGIETDQFLNNDKFLLHLWELIKSSMGQEVVEWVKTSLHKFGKKTVCRVNCIKATKPVFLRQKGFDEAFYIRVGPGSSSLEISSALKYIDQHF